MAAPKRTPQKREADLLIIERMYLARHTQAEIAKVIGVDRSMIARDLDELRGRWMQRTAMNLDAKKSEELASINRLEMEYWDAWRRSQQEFKAQTVRKAEGKAKSAEVSQHTENRYGDPRFLQGVAWCVAKRCELLGLNAPLKIEQSLASDEIWTDERLSRIAARALKVARAKKTALKAKAGKA